MLTEEERQLDLEAIERLIVRVREKARKVEAMLETAAVYENPFAIVGIRGSVRRLTLVAGGLTLVITNAHCDLQNAWAKFVDPLDNSRTEMLLLALADIGISRRPQDFAFLGARSRKAALLREKGTVVGEVVKRG